MKEKTLLSKREWLNPKKHSDTGLMASDVTADEWHVSAEVSIWDCSRKIELNFTIYNEKDAVERAEKLDKMIAHLTEVKAALGKGYTIMQKAKDLDKDDDNEEFDIDG